ncbi:hypothetical protein HPB50_026762 [Hyalomma asiaticum]|uniref:Uncharacterized protein n=1 Tax=Hyalomma asiaticum TaxID=266040 RepID=A0ACB7RZK8_HYAAI|nr:hypothetical protein HPB50_026762 [Hyalomma asiaticum]
MGKKKRTRSSSAAPGAPKNTVDHPADITDASPRGNRGAPLCSSPQGRQDSKLCGATQPEAMSDLISSPRDDSPVSSAYRHRTPSAEPQKAALTAGLAGGAPAGTISPTETSPRSPAVESSTGVGSAVQMGSSPQSTVSPVSPLYKLEDSHSALRPPGTLRSPTSPCHLSSTVTPLDQVLVFGHGKFQWTTLLCTQLAVFCTAIHAVAMPSLARPVDHWCRPPEAYDDVPREWWKNSSIPVESDGSYSRCFRYEPPFSAYEGDGNLSWTVPCDAGWDYAVSIHTSIIAEWDLVCHRRWIMLVLTASYMGGSVVVMPFTGIAADLIGRVPVLVGALIVLVIAGALVAFSDTLFMFAILRVLISGSSTTLLVVSVVLLFEVTDSSHRVLYSSVAIAGGVSAANVYIEIMYDLVNQWALIEMINVLPSALLVGAVYFVQESPNWLLATHRFRRLSKVATAAAQTNGVDLEQVAKRLEDLHNEDRRSRIESYNTEGASVVSPLEVVNNPSLRYETMVVYGCWFLAMSLFDYLRRGHEDRTVYYAQIVLECPAVTANIYLLQRKGRRVTTAVSMIVLGFLVAALSAFCFLFPDRSDVGDLTHYLETAVCVAALLAVDIVTVSLSVITVEMYPTVIRGSGLSFAYVWGRLGAITMTFASSDSRRGRVIELGVVSPLLVAFGTLVLVAMPETTKMHATNLPPVIRSPKGQDDKWKVIEPLKVARNRRASSVADVRRKSMPSKLSRP